MPTKQGKYTVQLDSCPSVAGFAAIGSEKEAKGPMAQYIDILNNDMLFGQQSWEKAESYMQKIVVDKVLSKCGLSPNQISYVLAGDLLNQCIGSHYGLRELGIPFLGLYGACSTMAESLALGAMLVEGGFAEYTMAVTSSHFCSAERQFRFPLEYGGVRPASAQWTATAAGAAVLGAGQSEVPPFVRAVTIGCIEDKDVKDLNNMGGAMAPAAAQTLLRFFEDTGTGPDSYDIILTGDLGRVGSDLLYELVEREGYRLSGKHNDCGLMLYDRNIQKEVLSGGSGCGCSAAVLCSYILQSMREGKLNEVLFIATGALMSPTSIQQGESIPAVAHLVHLSTKQG